MFKVPGTKFPRFKKRGGKSSFFIENSGKCLKTGGKNVKLPKIGWVRLKEMVPRGVEFKSVTISERAGRWFMAFKWEVPEVEQTTHTDTVGVDLGITNFATVSDGRVVKQPKQKKLQQKLVRLQRQHSRRKKGSGRRKRTQKQIAEVHYRISNVRKDVTHRLTHDLAKNHGVIVIENLGVSGMMRNHHLAASIAAANFFEVRRQLTYKTQRYGSQLVVASRWFPSSQICSGCGQRQKLPLHVRQYACSHCQLTLDRDLNAAKNLAASSAVNAQENTEVHAFNSRCGDGSVKNSELLHASNS